MLNNYDLNRYHRQILLDGLGTEGQERLKAARVFIAGAGGLGSPVSIYLTMAGVGKIRIVDRDKVELSNLNRQVLHWDKDVGRAKAVSAGEKLSAINKEIEVEAITENINESNIVELVGDSKLIVDAMDNFPTRYLLNKTALKLKIPFIYGSIYGLEGMCTTIIGGKTACLRCTFAEAPPPSIFPVVGVTPGVIGCIQATETIKYLTGIGQLLLNRLLLYDGINMRFSEVTLRGNPSCPDCSFLEEKNEI